MWTIEKYPKILEFPVKSALSYCTEVPFSSFLSDGFSTMAVINPPERKLAKSTSVDCHKLVNFDMQSHHREILVTLHKIPEGHEKY